MEIRQPTSALEVHQHIVCSLQKQDPVILDIGCYDGADSLHCLRLCPEAQLYWFEPAPGAVASLRETWGSTLKVPLPTVAALMTVAVAWLTGEFPSVS